MIVASDICGVFYPHTVGSKVPEEHYDAFIRILTDALKDTTPFERDGQAVITLPPEANALVRCGVGRVVPGLYAHDFVVRMHRGHWGLFLGARHAATTEKVDVVVYTREAYLRDPDLKVCDTDDTSCALRKVVERQRVQDADYVLVAVLAVAGPAAKGRTPYAPGVLVHNIAGGNNQFLPAEERLKAGLNLRQFVGDDYTGPHREALHDCGLLYWIVARAKESEQYHSEWMTVADPL